MNRDDVIAECDYLETRAIAWSENAGAIQHPNRTELVEPPDFQDVALVTAPLWGQRPSMCLTTASTAWRGLLASEQRHDWSVVACRCLEWDAQLEKMRGVYGEFLEAHPDEDWPLQTEGLSIGTDVLDRVQWISWASFTLVRAEIYVAQRFVDAQAARAISRKSPG